MRKNYRLFLHCVKTELQSVKKPAMHLGVVFCPPVWGGVVIEIATLRDSEYKSKDRKNRFRL